MPKPFSEEKRQEWKRLVEQWEKNDRKISTARWCIEQNINYNTFLYWKERFKSGPIRKIDRSTSQELSHAPSGIGVTIEYQQIRIQVAENFDAAILARCLRVLKIFLAMAIIVFEIVS
jgi:hypothetical protein